METLSEEARGWGAKTETLKKQKRKERKRAEMRETREAKLRKKWQQAERSGKRINGRAAGKQPDGRADIRAACAR